MVLIDLSLWSFCMLLATELVNLSLWQLLGTISRSLLPFEVTEMPLFLDFSMIFLSASCLQFSMNLKIY